MADTLTPDQRSRNMAAIKRRDTKPEVYIRKLLFAHGFRYRIDEKSIPGHPDIFLRKFNTAIFVHGCFWHRHKDCRNASNPKSRTEYWRKKFDDNIKRDTMVAEAMRKRGTKQLIIWECTIRSMRKDPELEKRVLTRIEQFLHNAEMRELEL